MTRKSAWTNEFKILPSAKAYVNPLICIIWALWAKGSTVLKVVVVEFVVIGWI